MSKTPHLFTYKGQQYTVAQLAEIAGCEKPAMWKRLRTGTVDQAVAMGAEGIRSRSAVHAYQGKMLTTAELAALAGCPQKQMQWRLRNRSPKQAVAMGASVIGRPRPDARKPRKERVPRDANAQRWEHGGQNLTARELAIIAKCHPDTMRSRLLRGMLPAEAIALGSARANAVGTKPRKQTVHVKSQALRESSWRQAIVAKDKRKAAPQGDAIVPKGLVPQVAPKPRARFQVDEVPALFGAMRPGQYPDAPSTWVSVVAGR